MLTNLTPLVTKVVSKYHQDSLKNTLVIACQHLLFDAYLLFLALESLGLKKSNVLLMGKCYSSNLDVINKMKLHGYFVYESLEEFDSHRPYDEQFQTDVLSFVDNVLMTYDLSSYDKIVILDDGGRLISAFSTKNLSFDNFLGVEQTTSGFAELSKNQLKFKVVNVARSKTKLEIESIFIARIILEQLNSYLAKLNYQPKNWMILGHGYIGRALKTKLQESNIDPVFFDLNQELSIIKQDDFEIYVEKSDVILGCSGSVSLHQRYHSLIKKQLILASASSSDREFDAVHFRKKLPRVDNCHENMVINNVHLLNCGFPINFFGGVQSMPLHERQLTMSLIISAILNLHVINVNDQFLIIEESEEEYILNNFFNYYTSYLPLKNQ